MHLVLQDSKIENYLKESTIVDFNNKPLNGFAYGLVEGVSDNIDRIKIIYEFVRDKIHHSFDVGAERVTCRASEVLEAGHGICYAKSHLLVALLRSISIPAGFCYQGLMLSETDPRIVLHGLAGIYIKEEDKWIRLDARGNKPGVNAQFSLAEEKLAYTVKKELGEFDSGIIYSEPNEMVVNCLLKSKNLKELIENLPRNI